MEKSATQIVEGRRPMQTPQALQPFSSPGDRIRLHQHTPVRIFHLLQLCCGRRDPGIIEERAKVEDASGDFWNGEAEFRMEAEDITDEVISF